MIGFMTSRRGIMLVSKECWERGCSCYDDRVDKDPVEVVKWVGLTDEEVNEFYWISASTLEAIEEKLKEKNT
jgi:hypothetical protein